MAAEKLTTIVSTKGQVILPSAIRRRREWSAGTRLLVEETVEGVLLKPPPAFTDAMTRRVSAVHFVESANRARRGSCLPQALAVQS
jgi:AbrB family looped-hinge helix DNA binding protein